MTWNEYLEETVRNDTQRINFCEAVADIAFNDNRMNWLIILHGPAKSGKSFIVRCVSGLVRSQFWTNDQAVISANHKFWSTRGRRMHEHELARASASVLVTLDDFFCKLDLHKVKQVLSEDLMTAQFRRKDPFEFKPRFSLMVSTQEILKLGLDCALGSRAQVIEVETSSFDCGSIAFAPQDMRAPLLAYL